jgi:hypothetical protein
MSSVENDEKDDSSSSADHHHPPPRRKLGRRARKKRRRNLGIQTEAAIAIANGATLKAVETPANEKHTPVESSPLVDASNNVTTRVPSDRSYQQQSCLKLSKLTEVDREALIQQLGYLPGNALEVVARVKDAFPKIDFMSDNEDTDHKSSIRSAHENRSKAAVDAVMDEPLVIKLYPLVVRDETDGSKSRRKRKRSEQQDDKLLPSTAIEPFPTIFWVTQPRIKGLVSKLELDGMGRECEQWLKNSKQEIEVKSDTVCEQWLKNSKQEIEVKSDTPRQALSPLASMKKAHLAYATERRELLLQEDWDYIQQRKWDKAYSMESGVAGIRHFESVKCLHAHVAHFWSGCQDNVVGKRVADRLLQNMKGGALKLK